jgi:Terminase RNaseH-like domain
MLINGLDFIAPRNRLKIDSRSNSRHKPLPNNWRDFAALTEIRSGDGIVKFNPYPYQQSLIELVETHKLTVVGKSRQLGISETICNYFLYRACVDRSVLAVVLSLGQRETIDLARRVRFAIESLAPLGVTTTTDTLTDIQISGGGRLLFRPSNENSTRGLPAVTHCLIDEAGFVENVDRIYQAIIPATSTVANPKIVVVSTPNGATGWYHSMLSNGGEDLATTTDNMRDGSIDPLQSWEQETTGKMLIHWKCHPKFGKQIDYLDRIAQETGLSEIVISQEYDLSFNDRDEAVFSAAIVRGVATLDSFNKEPESGLRYYIGVDAAGAGADYTVAIVLGFDGTKNQYAAVDMYRSRKGSIESDIYKIGELIDKYSPLNVVVESNGVGQVFLEQIGSTCRGTKVEGFHTSQDSKIGAIERLHLALEKQMVRLPKSSPIVSELLSFRRVGKKLEAAPNAHDDCVMSLALALSGTDFKVTSSLMSRVNITTF